MIRGVIDTRVDMLRQYNAKSLAAHEKMYELLARAELLIRDQADRPTEIDLEKISMKLSTASSHFHEKRIYFDNDKNLSLDILAFLDKADDFITTLEDYTQTEKKIDQISAPFDKIETIFEKAIDVLYQMKRGSDFDIQALLTKIRKATHEAILPGWRLRIGK